MYSTGEPGNSLCVCEFDLDTGDIGELGAMEGRGGTGGMWLLGTGEPCNSLCIIAGLFPLLLLDI